MAVKKTELYSSLWASCDALRGGMDASQYKDYILTLLFMKYVTDKYKGQKYGDLTVFDKANDPNPDPEKRTGCSFDDFIALKNKKNIGEGIDKIIARLAEVNEGLKGVIDIAHFNDEAKIGKDKEMVDKLTKLIAIFQRPELDFSKNKAEGDDIIGDAYEYLMRSVKQLVIPSQKKIYISFKEYVELSLLGVEELLKDLLAYAKRYEILLNGNTKNKALDSCINRLNRLETTVTRPFFLEVLRLNNEGKLDISQVTDIFLITENYLFRRTICDLPTNALNKIFLKLHREIIRYDGTDANYVEKFKYALLSKKEKARFPDDDEFATQFTERQVYQMNSKNKIYILERLENYGTAEDKDVYSHCDDGTYSIEHIMPQHLTPAWVKALGDDYEQIHETWLHRIANLTLTAYNSKYSNSSFAEKKIMKNGFEDSGIRMNTYIAKKEKWTLTELEERNQYLMGRALEIWLTPSTEFKPEEKQLDSYTLDDDANLSGRLIARFSYKNTEQPATSWVEMFQKVLQILYAEDKNVITKLAASKEDNIALHFSMNETDFTKSAEIGDGIYVWTNTSTQSKLSVLSRVFKLYDADPTDLVFYLRDENEGVEDEVGTRYELRRKYWTYALDYIKKTHGEGGSFSNVNPSKENWINGFFGISGFSLCCVANYDSARVELYFGKAKKEDNKKAFDAVILHKDAIENSLGVKLIWNRGDDIKSSKISYQINNVSIENETDWLQMAKFHAHWSKKFYDVIVPYLR